MGVICARSLTIVSLIAAASLISSGCGSKEELGEASQGTGPTVAAKGPSEQSRTNRGHPPYITSSRGPAAPPSPRLDPSKLGRKVRERNGAVVVLPPRPKETSASPGGPCEQRKGSRGPRQYFPPAPGISAERAGANTIEVSYRFAPFDPKCRPQSLELTLDVNGDTFPGSGAIAPVRAATGQIALLVPERLRQADVAYAIARTKDGLPSRTSSVLIKQGTASSQQPAMRLRVP
jgi:hypothetical protein